MMLDNQFGFDDGVICFCYGCCFESKDIMMKTVARENLAAGQTSLRRD
jgi:hypothetical protein